MTDETKPDGPRDDGTTALVAAIEQALDALRAVRFEPHVEHHPDGVLADKARGKAGELLGHALAHARTMRAMHACALAHPEDRPPDPTVF